MIHSTVTLAENAHTKDAWSHVIQAAARCHSTYTDTNANQRAWLEAMLAHNQTCNYLCRYGSPRTQDAFRRQVPLCSYDDIRSEIDRIAAGGSHILFTGRPLAYEKTGGSSAGRKLIPYTEQGLADFQRNLLPWLAETVQAFDITGRAYFSISPAVRQTEYTVDGIPIGLPDSAYFGKLAGTALQQLQAVSPEVATLTHIEDWKNATTHQLQTAHDLELISVWSPTFLLRLLDAMPDAPACWPRLKLISCWAHGPAQRYANELQQRLPQANIQPKGLLATEGIMTVPQADGHCRPAPYGFTEFLADDATCYLFHELRAGCYYEVVLTTASGLYRYRTGDRVLCIQQAASEHHLTPPMTLVFAGRNSLHSDLVGEKLTEAFAANCLRHWPGYALLIPDITNPGYVLVAEQQPSTCNALAQVEQQLCTNPQYAYARRIGQLAPLRLHVQPQTSAIVEQTLLQRGIRLGDIKPLALRPQIDWLTLLDVASS